MVAASKKLVPIMADCSAGGAHAALLKKYDVKGFPTVLFLDSKGEKIETLNSRDAAGVKAQMEEIAEKHSAKLFLDLDLAKAIEAAQKEHKPLAIVFLDEADKKQERKNQFFVMTLLSDDFKAARERFVWIKRPLKDGKKLTDEAKTFKTTVTMLVLVDPTTPEDKRGSAGVIKRWAKVDKKLAKELEKQADAWAKKTPKPEAKKDEPKPEPKKDEPKKDGE